MNRKQVLLSHWLPVFNEQMHDCDEHWENLELEKAPQSLLFLLWLRDWGEDSRGKLFDLLTSKGAEHG